jgi:predicted DNA-binding helix-hairpin-helix protein
MGEVRLGIDARSEKGRKTRPPKFAPAGQSTQLIVGADAATDGEILGRSAALYGGYKLRRVYYSAFSPIPDATARLSLQRPPMMREHRLYQADWLMRFYGFAREEIAGTGDNLDLAIDPKLAWALRHRERFPVDVNRADRETLLRTPGLGVKSVDRLIGLRRLKRLTLEDVQRVCRGMEKVKPFVVADGWSPLALADAENPLPRPLEPAVQLSLF